MLNTPFAEILPPLSREEYDALAADIDANGVQTPIVIDEDNNILDGHHRYKICPDAPVRTIDGLTHDEKIAYVLRSNLTRLTRTSLRCRCQVDRRRSHNHFRYLAPIYRRVHFRRGQSLPVIYRMLLYYRGYRYPQTVGC